MENINESEGVDELSDVVETEGDDSTDWQAEHKKLTEKVIRARERNKVIRDEVKTLKTELDTLKASKATPPPSPERESKKQDDIDFGELAYHNTKPDAVKIIRDEDIEYLKTWKKDTGRSLKDVLSSPIFQAELRARQEARTTQEATPPSTRRSGEQSNALDIAYSKYLQTGKLPSDPELKMKVVNKRQERERLESQFTPTPVVEQ